MDFVSPVFDTHTNCDSIMSSQSKTSCFKCGTPNPSVGGGGFAANNGGGGFAGSAKPPNFKFGDWMCPSCNAHNYRNKTQCYKCGTDRPADDNGAPS